jgi:hypothetical protein
MFAKPTTNEAAYYSTNKSTNTAAYCSPNDSGTHSRTHFFPNRTTVRQSVHKHGTGAPDVVAHWSTLSDTHNHTFPHARAVCRT